MWLDISPVYPRRQQATRHRCYHQVYHPRWLIIVGVLSCSDVSTGTNPSFFPSQSLNFTQTTINGVTMQPVNFHLEPLRIGNLFNSLLGGFGAASVQRAVSQSGNTALLPCAYTFSKDY